MTQTELQFIHTAKQREKLLQDVSFDAKRNKILLAAILREVAKYPPGTCYVSQQAFGRMFKCSQKSIQRAIAILKELDLLAVERKSRSFDGDAKTLNHYSVNWTELERRTVGQIEHSGENETGPTKRTLSPDQTDTYAPTKRTLRADQTDTWTRPNGHLGPTKRTAGCPPIEKNDLETTTTGDSMVVVVSNCGVFKAGDAVNAARRRGLSDAEIQTLCDSWRKMPKADRNPAKLFNWLAVDGSYRPPDIPRPSGLRGDALTREESERNLLVYRIVKKGRKQGASQEEIEEEIQRRLQSSGI